MTYIIVRRGPEPGRVYPVEKDQVRLGRGSRNDIIIHDNDVYREHLLLVNTQEGYELHDLTTDHSTSVNGQVVDGVWLLQSNCIIELGDAITLEYRLGDPADEVATAEVPTAPLQGESQNQAYLIVTLNSQPEPAVYPLEGAVVKVGRGQTNDVIIVEPEMSREHFRLTLTQRGYAIEDLNSTNGTMVNGDILNEPTLLRHGDLIQIGTMVQIQYTGSPESYTSKMKVDTTPLPLNSPTVPAGIARKTTALEVPSILGERPTKPVNLNTGVEHTSLKDQVLVTYARDDWETRVAPLINKLYEAKIDTWVDQYLMMGGADWYAATEQARLECWALIVVVTPAAMRSELVRKNWRHFQNREKPIILFVQEAVEHMPIGAHKMTNIFAQEGTSEPAYQQLVAELKRLRSS